MATGVLNITGNLGLTFSGGLLGTSDISEGARISAVGIMKEGAATATHDLPAAKATVLKQLPQHIANMNNRAVVLFFNDFNRKTRDGEKWSFIRRERGWWRLNKYGNTSTYCKIVKCLKTRAYEKYNISRDKRKGSLLDPEDSWAEADWEHIRPVREHQVIGFRSVRVAFEQ